MVAAYGLQSVQDVLLVSYFDDIINDVEFTVLYEENYSRGIFRYWKLDKFDVNDWDEAECKVELRFDKYDLAVLLHNHNVNIDSNFLQQCIYKLELYCSLLFILF